jgi:hypothetical protein
VHPADRPVFGEPALARAQVNLLPPVAALRSGDPLEDGPADPGPEAVHLFIIGAGTSALQADLAVLETLLPAARAQDLQRQLPGLTSGEGVAETSFGGYRPVAAAPAEQAQSSGGR